MEVPEASEGLPVQHKVKRKGKSLRYWADNNENNEQNEDSEKNTSNENKKESEEVEEYVLDQEVVQKYRRGKSINVKNIKNKKLKSKLKNYEANFSKAAKQAARAELLLPEETGYLEAEGLEKTYKFSQREISKSVGIASAAKSFELKLDTFGPYRINYTKNGRFLLIGGLKGHLATMDWSSKRLGCEFHVQETVRDIKWLHQETMFAVAQKKNVYIYDNTGMELHCLKKHRYVNKMEYLPYHFLLATVANSGFLRYQDTSTGKMISEVSTRLGNCDCMTKNPYNAIINLGHANGTVTMWSPAVREPLVKMLTHRGPLKSIAVDNKGLYMATSGVDGMLKVWDIRTYKSLYAYRLHRAAHSLSISHKGQLAVGFGPHVYVYHDAFTEQQKMPYMSHLIPSSEVVSLEFCPFEDVLGVGHSYGFSSLLIPGSGEANIDALEANPYETKKQRREHEVKMLLEKIQPDLITLEPNDIMHADSVKHEKKSHSEAQNDFEPKYKTKGKGTSVKLHQRKKGVKQETKRDKLKREMLERKEKERSAKVDEKRNIDVLVASEPGSALDRFKKKAT
eukprot:gene16154-17777_t